METKTTELQIEICSKPDLRLIPKDIVDAIVVVLELEISETVEKAVKIQ